MSKIIEDLFDTDEISMPVSVQMPERKKITIKPVEMRSNSAPDPAYTVIKKNSLTETEHEIYNVALEGIDAVSRQFGKMDERLARDCAKIKLELLDILARKFGYRNATAAKDDGLSFKLKGNYEVELLKAR